MRTSNGAIRSTGQTLNFVAETRDRTPRWVSIRSV